MVEKQRKFVEKRDKLHQELIADRGNVILDLTIFSLSELLAKLRNGELDPVAVLEAYQVHVQC